MNPTRPSYVQVLGYAVSCEPPFSANFFSYFSLCAFSRALDTLDDLLSSIGPCVRFGVQFSRNVSPQNDFFLVLRIIPEDNVPSIDCCCEHNGLRWVRESVSKEARRFSGECP